MFTTSMTKYVRKLSLVAALLLSVSLILPARANSGAPVSNPEFGTAPNCTTSNWTVFGNVTALTEAQAGLSASTNCIAHVKAALGSTNTDSIATISQRMQVPAYALAELRFTYWAYSDQPASSTTTQMITLRASDGRILYTKSHNMTSAGSFSYLLVGMRGQIITLEVSTFVEQTGSKTEPRTAILSFDHVEFIDIPPGPDGSVGGGW